LDESTDITAKAQLLAFGRFVCNVDIIEPFLFFKPLPETTKGQDILDVVDSDSSSHDLSWKSCISSCTGGGPSMQGSLKGFVPLATQKNTGNVFAHCFLHREALISKLVVPEFQKVLDETIKMVNYIKSSPYNRGCFQRRFLPWKLLTHKSPTEHGRVVAMSRWMLSRFYKLREEFIIFSRLKSLSWLTCLVMRPGAIKLLS
jgi:hypothetical protein